MGLKQRNDTTTNWVAANPTLEMGERGYDRTLGKWKTGDGTTAWNSLAFDSTTGAYVPGGTDVAVADGGTGASTASVARTNLGLAIGTDVLAPSGSGASLTGIYVPGGTDVAVADGGTGASSASAARTNLGLVIGTDVAPVTSPTFAGTVTLPATGGASTAARADYVESVVGAAPPSFAGFSAWSFDPVFVNAATIVPTLGTLNLVKLWTPRTLTGITKIYLMCTVTGGSLTNVGVGIWQANGTLRQASVNANGATGANFGTGGGVGLKTVTVTSTSLAAGDYVGFWFNGGVTAPTLSRVGLSSVINGVLTAPNLRSCTTSDTGLTTTAPATFGTQTAVQTGWFVAVA